MTSSDVVATSVPTAEGKGRLYRIEPGKRIALERWDQWQPNRDEPLLDRCARVSFSPEERERRRQRAKHLKERLSEVPFYAKAAEKDGEGYSEKFYASRVQS